MSVDLTKKAIKQYGTGCCSSRSDYGEQGGVGGATQSFTVCSGVPGNTQIVRELETNIARFVGKEDAVVFGMGFATNSTNMRCLVSKVSGHIW